VRGKEKGGAGTVATETKNMRPEISGSASGSGLDQNKREEGETIMIGGVHKRPRFD
jgi:hypothetical protein